MFVRFSNKVITFITMKHSRKYLLSRQLWLTFQTAAAFKFTQGKFLRFRICYKSSQELLTITSSGFSKMRVFAVLCCLIAGEVLSSRPNPEGKSITILLFFSFWLFILETFTSDSSILQVKFISKSETHKYSRERNILPFLSNTSSNLNLTF